MLTKYSDWAPTGLDRKGLKLTDRQDWLVCPCLRTTISTPTEKANFESILIRLKEADSDTWEHHAFAHWGPKTVEVILVKPGTYAAETVERLAQRLKDHGVIDERIVERFENEAIERAWDNFGRDEFLAELGRQISEGDIDLELPQGLTNERAAEVLVVLDPDKVVELIEDGYSCKANASGSQVSFNFDALVRDVDTYNLQVLIVEEDFRQRRETDIRKLVQYLGFFASVADVAVERDIATVPGIRKLASELALQRK